MQALRAAWRPKQLGLGVPSKNNPQGTPFVSPSPPLLLTAEVKICSRLEPEKKSLLGNSIRRALCSKEMECFIWYDNFTALKWRGNGAGSIASYRINKSLG